MAETLPYGYKERTQHNQVIESGNFYTGELKAKRIFTGPWSDRFNFLATAYLQPFQAEEGAQPNYLELQGFYPDIDILKPISWDIKGQGKQNQGTELQAKYDRAEITVNYESVFTEFTGVGGGEEDPPPEEITIITEDFDSTAEEIVFDVKNVVDINANEVRVDKLPFYAPVVNWRVKQHYVLLPNWQFILVDAVGACNSETFYLPNGIALEARVVLYNGPQGFRKYTLNQKTAYEITHSFSIRDKPNWQQKRMPDGSIKVMVMPDGDLLQKEKNLNLTFRSNVA